MAKKESSEAAKKIAKAEKEKTSKKPSNKPNVFVRMGKAIKNFFKNSKGDLKKITWPGAKEVLKGNRCYHRLHSNRRHTRIPC